MYVCKKKNPSGVVSVQVIDRSIGRYKLIKTVGSSSSSEEVERLYRESIQFNPLSCSLFNGAQYEDRTVIPTVEDFVTRFKLDGFAAVSDSGLMNKTDTALLESANYKYIIGAGIKNESDVVKMG
jgi:hypothetical protein